VGSEIVRAKADLHGAGWTDWQPRVGEVCHDEAERCYLARGVTVAAALAAEQVLG
jgi:hypothetical protein